MTKKILGLLIAAAALAVFGGFYFWRGGLVEAPKFRTLPITRGDLILAVNATGTVEPVEIIDVGAQVVGSVRSFGPDAQRPGKTIDYGSRVKKGDVLAQLDDSALRAELEKAQVNLKLAEADVKRIRTRRDQAQRDVRRAEQLRDTISAGEREGIVSEYEISQAELAMSEARLAQAKIAARQAEINLGYTTIRSPVDGVVIDRRVNVGQTVVVGLNAPSLFLLARDLNRMLVWAAVNEADIGDIKVGQNVTFKVDAYRDQVFLGKVSQIRLNASLSQNVVSYGVVVDVDNSDGRLFPYMTAKLQFEVAGRHDALLAPNQALRWCPTLEQVSPSARSGLEQTSTTKPGMEGQQESLEKKGEQTEPTVCVDSPTVWVLAEDGLVRPVAVQTGLTDGLTTELTGGGVGPGTIVVVNAEHKAKPDFVSGFISKVTNTKK